MSKTNDLEGAQDQGGKHGGQAGMPRPVAPPKPDEPDALQKQADRGARDLRHGEGGTTDAPVRPRDLAKDD